MNHQDSTSDSETDDAIEGEAMDVSPEVSMDHSPSNSTEVKAGSPEEDGRQWIPSWFFENGSEDKKPIGSPDSGNSTSVLPTPVQHLLKKKKRRHELQFDQIVFGEKIGEGSFGEVWKGTLWGQEVALKKLRVSNSHLQDFKKEVNIMKRLRHPNIVEFLGATFEHGKMCIVTEFLSQGSLESKLEKLEAVGKKLSMKRVLAIAKDITRGLNWLHHQGIIHRDLKPANLLVDSSNKVKLADFGLSHVKLTEANRKGDYGCYGTPCYMAPEVLNFEPYSAKADVFSFGVVLCELIIGKYPWEDAPESSVRFEKAIISGLRPTVPENTIPELKALIEDCWEHDPDRRPTVDEIMQRLFAVEQKLKFDDNILDDLPDEAANYFAQMKGQTIDMKMKLEQANIEKAQLRKELQEAQHQARVLQEQKEALIAQFTALQQEHDVSQKKVARSGRKSGAHKSGKRSNRWKKKK